mgnify:CR=1 FL=1
MPTENPEPKMTFGHLTTMLTILCKEIYELTFYQELREPDDFYVETIRELVKLHVMHLPQNEYKLVMEKMLPIKLEDYFPTRKKHNLVNENELENNDTWEG